MESPRIALDKYPRPQFVRDGWMNLNGVWDFEFDDADAGEKERWFSQGSFTRKINVPFVFESKASLIGDTSRHDNVWYRRNFILTGEFAHRRVVLNFQGVDYVAKVWVNGVFIGSHKGAYTKFSFDISNAVHEGENTVTVKAEDSYSCRQPRGKQKWADEKYLCWYTQSTGIWKTVWLEFTSDACIEDVKMTPYIDDVAVEFEYNVRSGGSKDLTLKTEITFAGLKIREFTVSAGGGPLKYRADIYSDAVTYKCMPWTPATPNLYDVKFTLFDGGKPVDEVCSYFGMRKINVSGGRVWLNNSELYQKLILEQGYWEDTLLTAPDEDAIIKDIELTKKMGFNGMRIHQKIEDDRFLYECDRMGMLTYAEMPSAYEFSDDMQEDFACQWAEVVRQQHNHPSIIAWVPFNESWGVPTIRADKKQQSFTQAMYYLTKALDGTRPVITNDGWEHTISDMLTIHDYEQYADKLAARYADREAVVSGRSQSSSNKRLFADGFGDMGQPMLISEFGGIAFDGDSGWGYGDHASNKDEFVKRFTEVVCAIKDNPSVMGYCYTQLTDVQQEVNGLLTVDRQPKVPIDQIAAANSTTGFKVG
jgi:beta-galactosidase/beta-glucuronidase